MDYETIHQVEKSEDFMGSTYYTESEAWELFSNPCGERDEQIADLEQDVCDSKINI